MGFIFLLLALVPGVVTAACECGYSVQVADQQVVFTDLLETDFTQLRDISQSTGWLGQQFNVSAQVGRGPYGKTFSPNNIAARPVADADPESTSPAGGLELRVGSAVRANAVPSAEIDTKRVDLHWGSYRAGMKLTSVNGTCAAFFWYFNDTQEIDIEFLSREFDRDKRIYPINLVVQSKQSMESGYDASATGTFSRVNLSFDPTTAYHEYRFDYVSGHVLFYADSELIGHMEGDDIPSSAGHLILQHWSNGNPLWSGGPPNRDAVMSVSYVKAYFNSSDGQRLTVRENECHDAFADRAECVIPEVTASNASTGGSFFGDGRDVTGHQPGSTGTDDEGDDEDDEDDEESGSHHPIKSPVMTMALAMMALF